jgi:hypothetical protein
MTTRDQSNLPTVEGVEYVTSAGDETSWDPSTDELDRGEIRLSSPWRLKAICISNTHDNYPVTRRG